MAETNELGEKNSETQGIGDKISSRLERLEEKVAIITQKAQDGAVDLKNRASVYGQGAQEFLDSMALYVKENPQRSALIAGGVGLGLGIIVGLLLRNKD